MLYKISKITYNILNLYKDYFPEQYNYIKIQAARKNIFFVAAVKQNKTVGALGVLDKGDGFYQYSHLVVHKDYRQQGIAKGLIENSVELLKSIGAKRIRNHKRTNVIKHNTFTDLGFKLVGTNEHEKDYKWTYQLDLLEDK